MIVPMRWRLLSCVRSCRKPSDNRGYLLYNKASMKQIRKGRYTKPRSRFSRATSAIGRRFKWFNQLSRKKKVALIAGPIVAFLILVPIGTYIYYLNDIKDQERLMNRNNTGVVFKDKDGEVFYSVGRAEHRNMIPLDQISPSLKDALVAAEDKDFYNHGGFNPLSIVRAAVTGYGGGSTITQQLAKNTLLSSERSYLRKYQELFISMAIEQNYTKEEILSMYINSVFYGENSFGIDDAASVYFDKTPAELDLAESSMLIGLLPAPSVYSPISGNRDYAKQRQLTVLSRMVENDYITQAELEAAHAQELVYAERVRQGGKAPHFVQTVMDQLNEQYGEETIMRSGYQVTTTLDSKLQAELERQIANHRSFINANGGSNASGVAVDPLTGQVRAMVGSADFANENWGMVNMTTTARQPGSSFKPIYYAGALAQGVITPATVYRDEAINLSGWRPQNADRSFRGDVTVRSALSQSLNIPSVKVMQDFGIDKSVATARALGIESIEPSSDHGLALSLGSAEATLLEMTGAYAALANNGTYRDTQVITEIDDKFNHRVFRASSESRQALSQGGAFLISDILSDNAARAPIFGGSLTVAGRTVAVKTGTTDEARDAWTIGYTPSIAIGVWVGNNDNMPMLNGGAGMAGPIWRGTMAAALAGQPNEQFTAPASVVQRSTCYSNHGIATNDITEGTYREYYLASALPRLTCTPEEPEPIEVCDLRRMQVVEILERNFDGDIHSRDIDDCEEDEDMEDTIEVCELATGDVITIDEADFDSELHSRNTNNCEPPEETPGPPGQNPGPPVNPSL